MFDIHIGYYSLGYNFISLLSSYWHDSNIVVETPETWCVMGRADWAPSGRDSWRPSGAPSSSSRGCSQPSSYPPASSSPPCE